MGFIFSGIDLYISVCSSIFEALPTNLSGRNVHSVRFRVHNCGQGGRYHSSIAGESYVDNDKSKTLECMAMLERNSCNSAVDDGVSALSLLDEAKGVAVYT